MKFEKMLFSKSVLFSFALVLVVSITLTFFPLIGTLGFEFSATSAVLLSFLSVFVSSSLISSSLLRDRSRKDLSGTIGSIFIINFLLLLLAYVIGLASSVIKEDCFIKEGSIFFVLIPVVSVYFSATLGMLTGYIFGKKGIFIGLSYSWAPVLRFEVFVFCPLDADSAPLLLLFFSEAVEVQQTKRQM